LTLLLDPLLLLPGCVGRTEEREGDYGLVAKSGRVLRRREYAARIDEFPGVVFSSGNELFALRFSDLSEVIESGETTPLPGAAPEIAGVG